MRTYGCWAELCLPIAINFDISELHYIAKLFSSWHRGNHSLVLLANREFVEFITFHRFFSIKTSSAWHFTQSVCSAMIFNNQPAIRCCLDHSGIFGMLLKAFGSISRWRPAQSNLNSVKMPCQTDSCQQGDVSDRLRLCYSHSNRHSTKTWANFISGCALGAESLLWGIWACQGKSACVHRSKQNNLH